LDAGCGMGHLRNKLNLTIQQYTGVELNHAFVRAGRERFPGIKLVAGTLENIPFPDSHFDCVICSDVLIHIADMAAGLREIIRVSKADVLLRIRSGNGASQVGKIVYDPTRRRLFSRVQVHGTWQYFYYNVLAPEDLSALLREAGITEYQHLDLLPPNSNELGVTKVFFNVQQAKPTFFESKSKN
jgi:ubiquinone/menaquinone biosynthesis C-methylase UbiE